MIRPVLLAAAFATLATPALANPNCLGGSGGSGVTIKFGASVGGRYTEQEQEVFDKMHLRQRGIRADWVERTSSGCLKVIRRNELNHWVMEYYDPDTFEQKPLNLRLP